MLEIQPSAPANPIYRDMAHELGYTYETVWGIHSDNRGNRPLFTVDCAQIAEIVDNW